MRILMIAAIALMTPMIAQGQTRPLMERIERDELKYMADEDPHMAVAMRKARASLADFFAAMRHPTSSMSAFAVKIPIRDGDVVEYFWITQVSATGGGFSGRIDNTPRDVSNVVEGQVIEFRQEDIVDWMYLDGRRMKGNFTLCALMKDEPKRHVDAVKRKFGLKCDG